MKFRYLNKKEEELAIIHILETLLDDSIPYSGSHRKKQWEKGWAENLESGNGVPKYFGKYKIQRLNGRFITSDDPDFERNQLYTIVDSLAKKYLSSNKLNAICEIGCGTGHNLWRLKKVNPGALIQGWDWTKSSNEFVESQGFSSSNFDFFNPASANKLAINTGVITVAALEQVGTKFKPFVKYLLKNKPAVVVHIEPMPEYLDSTKLIDYLSIQYMHKRNYLRGYRDYIEKLEKEGKVKILESKRSGIGSMMIDGYSILVWKPL